MVSEASLYKLLLIQKVSVIIPTYRRPTFLHRAIASVLNQTFQHFELIIVDDASHDNTHNVVSSFYDPRIRYINHESNKGAAAARNTGIINAQSEYLAFLDDDDEWLPEKLRLQIALLDNSPSKVGGIYTGHIVVDETSGNVLRQRTPNNRGNLSNILLSHNCLGSTSSMLLRKECFDTVGLFDESLPSFQDYDLWIRISRSFEFDYINKPLYKYHLHNNKIWTNPESLSKGIEIMLERYGTGVLLFRKYLSNYYHQIGKLYYHKGNRIEERHAYLKAIKLNPFKMKYYYSFCLSLLNPKTHNKLRAIKRFCLVPISHRLISAKQEKR